MLIITSYAKSYPTKSIKVYSIRELLCTVLTKLNRAQEASISAYFEVRTLVLAHQGTLISSTLPCL